MFEDEVPEDDGIELDVSMSLVREVEIKDKLKDALKSDIGFGVGFLDSALINILPSDLVVIGGRAKQGKSQLAVEIAKHNAIKKKEVLFIALEAERLEIEMRLKYEILSSLFFRQNKNPFVNINYRSWRLGRLEDVFSPYEKEAISIFTERYLTLNTQYRGQGYDIRHLNKTLDRYKDEADLIIIDHFHFFDMYGKGDKYEKQADLIKRIRDLNLFYNKPIILLAHLRKDVFDLAPDYDSFMGTSDIGKVATASIMITRNKEFQDVRNQVFETIFSIPASRTGAIPVVGLHHYSLPKHAYSKNFDLGRITGLQEKQKVERLQKTEWPAWAEETAAQSYKQTSIDDNPWVTAAKTVFQAKEIEPTTGYQLYK